VLIQIVRSFQCRGIRSHHQIISAPSKWAVLPMQSWCWKQLLLVTAIHEIKPLMISAHSNCAILSMQRYKRYKEPSSDYKCSFKVGSPSIAEVWGTVHKRMEALRLDMFCLQTCRQHIYRTLIECRTLTTLMFPPTPDPFIIFIILCLYWARTHI